MTALTASNAGHTNELLVKSVNGMRLEQHTITSATDGDTYTIANGAKVVRFAWFSSSAVNHRWAKSGNVFTLTTEGAGTVTTARIWMWFRG